MHIFKFFDEQFLISSFNFIQPESAGASCWDVNREHLR